MRRYRFESEVTTAGRMPCHWVLDYPGVEESWSVAIDGQPAESTLRYEGLCTAFSAVCFPLGKVHGSGSKRTMGGIGFSKWVHEP